MQILVGWCVLRVVEGEPVWDKTTFGILLSILLYSHNYVFSNIGII